MEVVVFGSAIVDFICYVQRLPRVGETLHATKFCTGFGGKGANQCVAAAKLGAKTAMIAKLGDDAWGTSYMKNLREQKVNVDFVEQCKGETTGIAQISVAASGENHIIIVTGANNLLSSDDVSKADHLFKTAKILICQLETPLAATLAALRDFKGISILNAAPALAETPKELLQTASIFCVNESEAALMIGCSEIVTLEQSKVALQQLLAMGAKTVIITLGSLGAVYVKSEQPNEYIHVAARQIEQAVDTTGAGDAFIGSLAYFMVRYPEMPLHQHIGAACDVASYSVQFLGTQSSFPNSSQFSVDLSQKSYKFQSL